MRRDHGPWLGVTIGLAALMRARVTLALVALITLSALSAAVERRLNPGLAANNALTGATFGLLVPLAAYGIFDRISGSDRLLGPLSATTRYGASGLWSVCGLLTVGVAAAVLVATLLGCTALVAARGPSDPALVGDAVVTARIGALAGLSYALYFAAASTFGGRGQGRLWALLLDWTLGSGSSALALPWPRGHVRNLLGAEPVLSLSQPAATACLGAILVCGALFLLWRTRA